MIKRKISNWIVPVIILALVSCKKNGSEEEHEVIAVPVEHGTLTGVATKKNIGASGGTISTPDGNITIEIPAGAVTTATEFSIQPVTSTLPSATGTAYRIGPENVQFNKDVKISFKYTDEDLTGTSENELYLAFQDAEGYWNSEIMTGIDNQNRVLFANTKHFSDWTIERKIWIKNMSKEILAAGEQTTLIVYYRDVDEKNKIDPDKIEVKKANIGGWFLNGSGILNKTNEPSTMYTAPGQIINPETVVVGVNVKGLVSKRHPDRPGNSGLVIVQKFLQLVGEEYFVWDWGGTQNTAMSVDAASIGGNLLLIGTGLNGAINLSVNTPKESDFDLGDNTKPDFFDAQVSASREQTVIYTGRYTDCAGKLQYGKGKLLITKYGAVGQPVEGAFEAVLYAVGSGCPTKSKTASGKFKIKRRA